MSLPVSRGFAVTAICLAAIFGSALPGLAAEPRATLALENGWRFKQASGLTGVESGAFDDASWSKVAVPHTWNRIGNEGLERSPASNNVQGIGWYRLHFKTPVSPKNARYFLQFDGVGTIAQVWLNGTYLGKHAGAFARFRFDASAAIHPSGDNLLVVQADNSLAVPGSTTQDIVPLSGDFFMFGGIYRNVSLIVTNPVHVDMLDYGGPGVYARALKIEPASAEVKVSARLKNDGLAPVATLVETVIEDAAGKVVAKDSHSVTLASQPASVEAILNVAQPRLWQGIKAPYLYHATVTLRSPKGAILDRVTQPLGLRTMRFDADKGFFLNGEHLFLKGVGLHQDRPVKGWAVSRADQEQDLDILADLGANAVRMAHYQHDQPSYDAADAKGIVVWAEIPVVNKVSFDGAPASPALTANTRQQLTELIRQNFNHPSIAVWSIGNETDNTPSKVKGPSQAGALLKGLNALAHSEDPGRSTTLADCCEVGIPPQIGRTIEGIAPRDSVVGIADTVGYNRYFGWYNGKLGDFGPMLDQAHARHPQLPMSVSEYGVGAALTQHSDDPSGGVINSRGRPHPEEFQNLYHESAWSVLKARPYIWGVYVWNMFDFSSDARLEGDLTDVNDKGLVTADRHTYKDAFYFYRANWNAAPTLHLVGRRYADRPYGVVDVKAYSNAAEAKLWLNGKELGPARCEGGVCLWPSVHLGSGANDLRASAEISGKPVSDSLRWTFSGAPGIVRIKAGDNTGYTARDGSRYGSDLYFSGGEAQAVNVPVAQRFDHADLAAGAAAPASAPVQGNAGIAISSGDPRLYDSFREGDFSYRIPVPDGRYHVTILFQEPSASAAGERMFDVAVNGKAVLQGFDIFAAAGGKLKSTDRTFDAEAKDGTLSITFHGVKGKAVASAISVVRADEAQVSR
ncbi:MAG TPA: glycoside hydrolase family 2 TIM barrel-domain containing protein [Rhizomicrobium sp.]|nr:glycoside hydrolase family 2 TIM barrel-domain containing protein [Rhizomicrobium sp.]